MKREELKAYNVYSTRGDGAYGFCKEADPTDVELEKVDVYIAPEADEVMDAMEARIKEIVKALENAVAGGEIIKGLCERHEVRIKELEAENSRLKSIVGDEEYKEGLAGLAQRNVELREENERLKAQVPKWISVKDRLPDILEQVIIFYGNVFYCVTYYGETECWGVCENVKFSPNVVNHWMPLPPPPTTEESSATEKEN